MVYRNYKPDDYYNAINYTKKLARNGTIKSLIIGVLSTLLFVVMPNILSSFIFAIGMSFSVIFGIMHIRLYQIALDIERKGTVTKEDIERVRRLSLRGF